MHKRRHHRSHYREQQKALMFSLSLAAIILVLTISSLMSLDQLILGSELNGDGSVEYLCLGRGCDGLTYLDW